LARIASANCGTAASQTFSYDPFGNISKSGSPYSFQPTYSPSTNRFATLPGFTPTYDANGNVLTDGSHTYAWDADGNSISLDGVGLTFDALDRMVEQNRSGTYTEIVYSPGGAKLALMSGQTLLKAFVPLPGQATAVYTSSGLDHYRHSDWLGSARLTSSPTRAVLSTTAYRPVRRNLRSIRHCRPVLHRPEPGHRSRRLRLSLPRILQPGPLASPPSIPPTPSPGTVTPMY